jgi:archaellum biogenesis protein FlaJ (TadC family)
MPLLKKIFESDKHFKNFIKYYGPKATAATGMSPYFLRKLYLEDEESFKDLMVDDHATNLAVGLAGSLLPAVD